jgi:hypothetical protein
MVEVTINMNVAGIANRLKSKSSQIDGQINLFHEDLLRIAQDWVRREAPRRTGRLRTDITKQKSGTQGKVFNLGKQAPYFRWVIDGRRGFCAYGEQTYLGKSIGTKKALRFKSKSGQWIIRRCVGPAKPNPYYDKAIPKMRGQMMARVQRFGKWLETL